MADLDAWIETTVRAPRKKGERAEQVHTTRMVPTRAEELLDGGSLYWVIKGKIQARQRIKDIVPFTGDDGVKRCHLVLESVLHAVVPRPRGPFQGWRYLDEKDIPQDLATKGTIDAMLPTDLAIALKQMGVG